MRHSSRPAALPAPARRPGSRAEGGGRSADCAVLGEQQVAEGLEAQRLVLGAGEHGAVGQLLGRQGGARRSRGAAGHQRQQRQHQRCGPRGVARHRHPPAGRGKQQALAVAGGWPSA